MNNSKLKCRAKSPIFLFVLIPSLSAASTVSGLAEINGAPLNYFLHSDGPASMPVMYLGWVFTALLVVIFFIIAFLLLWSIFRERAPQALYSDDHNDDVGMYWIYVGTGISTSLLAALCIYALVTLNTIAKPERSPALTLVVTGYDWWWKIDYEDKDPARHFSTANELHIPVGAPVLIKLKSADVIHTFWVPILAGKTQMIPGLTNQQWLQADVEAVYRGQCTQYCGVQHAHMGLEVIAQPKAAFMEWLDSQRKTAVTATSAGEQLFMDRCAGCHTIRGSKANGSHGPDLTHLNSRHLIAAGLLTNTPAHQLEWITHAQELKPGCRMPSMILTVAELSELSAYLAVLN